MRGLFGRIGLRRLKRLLFAVMKADRFPDRTHCIQGRRESLQGRLQGVLKLYANARLLPAKGSTSQSAKDILSIGESRHPALVQLSSRKSSTFFTNK